MATRHKPRPARKRATARPAQRKAARTRARKPAATARKSGGASARKSRTGGKAAPTGALARYIAKRNFSITPEPESGGAAHPGALQFVIQKHWATRLHYDFRLELGGTMKSWAVPKGPSFDTHDKRMAVHVEDHPISYNQFEGQIPKGQYGAGKVIIWDKGTWTPMGDPEAGYRKGELKFTLHGHKLHGAWVLVKIRSREGKDNTWLLIKEKDSSARPAAEFSVTDEMPDSVAELPMPGGPAAVPSMEDAPRKALPATLRPMLATLVDRPPANPEQWNFEVKFDGYRLLARVAADGVRLITRNGKDWTHRLAHLQKALQALRLKPCWLDGEIVVLDPRGAPSFQLLQNAFDSERTAGIQYFLFDLPCHDGRDLTGMPLTQRRALLRSLLQAARPPIRFSEDFNAAPDDLVASACKLGLEGVIGKRRNSAYVPRRSPDWIKLKCAQRQEFVVGGWTDPRGSRAGLGSLLLGVHDAEGKLVYAGKVGSGFNDTSLEHISSQLRRLAAEKSPFSRRVPESGVHWVRPELVAEVTFSEWTGDGHLRHPVFHALRTDKPAAAIVREDPVAPLGPDTEEAPADQPHSRIPASLKVSHPDRVVDESSGVTKIEVIRYYALVGELMMEHLEGRPVSLVRAPDGIGKAMFFQKHLERYRMDGVAPLDQKLDPEHPPYLEVQSPLGLLSAAQMNVIEFHSWNCVKQSFDRPDRIVFDLDPGEGVAWNEVRKGAELMRGFLAELKLVGFLKTSGGKGLHVVTPIRPEHDWDTVKAFSQAIVVHMARALPDLFVARSGGRNRVGKVFIDYLRNGFGATTASAWSVRARPGLGISVPLDWDELPRVESGAKWNVRTAHLRLAQGNAPWKNYRRSARSVNPGMKKLGSVPD